MLSVDELERRAVEAGELLGPRCLVCPRLCKIDRRADAKGLCAIGRHNINWVTPEHVVPQILEALPHAIAGGLRLPIVYNTSSYDSLDSLRLMEGVVDVYMPDLKLVTSGRARRYLKRADYPEVARRTIREMHRQV